MRNLLLESGDIILRKQFYALARLDSLSDQIMIRNVDNCF